MTDAPDAGDPDNNSGGGRDITLPEGVDRWSWGAFTLNWIWGLANETPRALWCLVPIANLFMPFYLGAVGRELAWRNRRWHSLEHFNHVQRLWSIWGISLALVGIALAVASAMLDPARTPAARRFPPPAEAPLAAAVFQPVFTIGDEQFGAGKIFLLEEEACGGRVLVTALHLLGPNGGLAQQLGPADVDARVNAILLADLRANQQVTEFAPASLTPADAAPCCERSAAPRGAGDILAFRAPPDLTGPALRRATKPVRAGDVLYLVSTGYNAPEGAVLHAATADEPVEGLVSFVYDDPALALQATSGAPLVNVEGQVVGINVGGGQSKDGRTLYGLANPATAWGPALVATCRARPAAGLRS